VQDDRNRVADGVVMTKKAPRPVSMKRLCPAVGQFVLQYASVQGTLRTLLLTLVGVKSNGPSILVYGMADEVVAKKVQIALLRYGRGYRRFEDAMKHLREVSEFRNRLLHWVPNTNPARTTLLAMVDAWRDHTNPNEPQINVTPETLRNLSRWLRLFEGDLLVMLGAINDKEGFDADMYRTLQAGFEPRVPKPEQIRK
jgi:hypothetical protein